MTTKTTPRSILHAMQANRIENERLLDLAHKAGIYATANSLGGGFVSLDRALQLAARSGVDLDEEI